MIDSLSSRTGTSIQWGKSTKIQCTEKTAKSAMTDGFVERVKSLAKEDAQKGIYMDKGYLQLQHSQMKQYVSPDRSGPMSQATQVLQVVAKEDDPQLELLNSLLKRLSGRIQHKDGQTLVSLGKMSGDCFGKIHHNSSGQTADIYAPNGETIASYNSNGGGWTVIQTQEELKFQGEADAVYAQAFREARAELAATQQTAALVQGSGETAGFDVQA